MTKELFITYFCIPLFIGLSISFLKGLFGRRVNEFLKRGKK